MTSRHTDCNDHCHDRMLGAPATEDLNPAQGPMASEVDEEARAFEKVVTCFETYLQHSLKALRRRQYDFERLRPDQRQLLPRMSEKFLKVEQALKGNHRFLAEIVRPHSLFQNSSSLLPSLLQVYRSSSLTLYASRNSLAAGSQEILPGSADGSQGIRRVRNEHGQASQHPAADCSRLVRRGSLGARRDLQAFA